MKLGCLLTLKKELREHYFRDVNFITSLELIIQEPKLYFRPALACRKSGNDVFLKKWNFGEWKKADKLNLGISEANALLKLKAAKWRKRSSEMEMIQDHNFCFQAKRAISF